MQANFGYSDGSGEYYLTIDTDRCNGCGDCVPVCPAHILELAENEFDPLGDSRIAVVTPGRRRTIKYDCGPCNPPSGARFLPCVSACKTRALARSW